MVITAWRYAANQLVALVSAPNGTTSITKVYAGDKGEPEAVYVTNGTLSWSYNASLKIITLTVLHNDQANIFVYWKIPGDVNGDGDVDLDDLYYVLIGYGMTIEEAMTTYGVPPGTDIDGDGDVDIDDLDYVLRDYGESA